VSAAQEARRSLWTVLLLGSGLLSACAGVIGATSPVMAAVLAGNPDRVRAVAGGGHVHPDGTLDVNAVNLCGDRPLHLAIQGGHLEIVQILLEKGADPDLPSETQRSGCIRYWSVTAPTGYPALHYAILAARPALAEAILRGGADPCLTIPSGQTAVDLARSGTGMEALLQDIQAAPNCD